MAVTLKAARVNRNYTRPDVISLLEEKGVKLSVNTLASYENNRTRPDIVVAKALADIYEMSVDDIIFL